MSLILKDFRADLSCSDDVEAFCDGLWVTRSLSRGCGCEVNLTPAGGGDRDCDEKHNKHDFRSVLKYERVGAIGLRVQWFLQSVTMIVSNRPFRSSIIPPAGPDNHGITRRANCCCNEAFRAGDRVPTMVMFDGSWCGIGCVRVARLPR